MLKEGDVIKEGPFAGFEVLSAYSRTQAIEDGVLVDVTNTAREAGIRFPVAVTQAVWNEYIVPDERSRKFGQSESGRLWDVLWMFRCSAKKVAGSTIIFSVYFIMKERQKRLVWLKAICGPGDNMEPVISIMRPDED